jgi:hypothetical protein
VADRPAFTVGRWARGLVEAWERTPRLLDDGSPNPARTSAGRVAGGALRTVAAHLGAPPAEVGPCVRCRAYHLRYGDRGGPLCPACRRGAAGPGGGGFRGRPPR